MKDCMYTLMIGFSLLLVFCGFCLCRTENLKQDLKIQELTIQNNELNLTVENLMKDNQELKKMVLDSEIKSQTVVKMVLDKK